MPVEQNNNTYYFKGNGEKEIEKFVGIETYSTSEIKGVPAIYKHSFKDFIVKEITSTGKILELKGDFSNYSFSEESKDKYTTFNLVKINKDTFEAIGDIKKALKIPSSLIHYSGLKDKCSMSVQKVSIKGDFIGKLKKLKIRDLFFRDIKPTKKRVKLGGNWGNNFTIVLRDIENKKKLKEIIDAKIKILVEYGFPNYFGLQRFGKYRSNSHNIGRYLLDEDYERAFAEYVSIVYSTECIELQEIRSNLNKSGDLKKAYDSFPKSLYYERSMIKHLINNPGDYKGTFNTLPADLNTLMVSSFQSHIFNKMISLRVKKGNPLFEPIKGDVIAILEDDNGHITKIKYIYGGLYDKYLEKAIKSNRAVMVVPIIGYNTNLDDFPLMKGLFREIIELEGIDDALFKSKLMRQNEFKGAFRAMTVKPTGLKIIELKDDDLFPDKKKLKLEFSLPKGSYATLLLRELLN